MLATFNVIHEVVVVAEEVTHQSGGDETPVECSNCGYTWEYGGELQKVTCPSCQHKTLAEDDD